MLNKPFYFGITKKVIVAFGNLFSNIQIERKQDDSVTGTTAQTIAVPLAYSNKEKWLTRIHADPNLENYTYTSLPRIAFEITGYEYDSSRKTNKMQKILCGNGTGSMTSTYAPVPYNIEISLYILTKTQEDGLQILEQILPTFTPDYTLSINAVPDMNIVQDIPIVLNSVVVDDEFEGDMQQRRFVTHTLSFTVKTNMFGPIHTSKIITKSIVNVAEDPSFLPVAQQYTAIGDPNTLAVTQSWIEQF